MHAKKIQTSRKKSTRENNNKNKSRSIITYRNSGINLKQKNNNNNYIYQMKNEILGKRYDDLSIYNKKTSRNTKQKSIDNSSYNQNLYQNSSVSYINTSSRYQKKSLKQQKKPNNKEQLNNIFTLKEPNRNMINKNNLNINITNIKNTPYQKSQNLTTNSNYSMISFSNIVNEPTSSNEKFDESKDIFNDSEIFKPINNGRIVTTFLQIDELTPIPDRIGAKQHYLAEYDYDEAKRAAVTCRRIEYSYNLRNIIKSEICLDDIIKIQRWWREILKKKNRELLKELQIQEKIKLNDIQNYILFLNKIHYIYTMHLVKKFINRLKMKFAKLYYKNFFNRKAKKIQNVYRQYILSKKLQFQSLLKRLAFKKKKRKLFYYLDVFIMNMNKIIKLQNFIKYYFLNKNEKYYLKMANKIHPFMYYYLKYGIGDNDKSIYLIKYKIKEFLNMIEKWKKLVFLKKKMRAFIFLDNIKFIIKKKYFTFFILRIVERINSMITYFLLKPLMKDIIYIYYRKKLEKIILRWKANVKIMKRRDILMLNIVLKIIDKFAFKPFIKKMKKRIFEIEEIE